MSGLRRADDADVHPMLVDDEPVVTGAAPAPGAPVPDTPLVSAGGRTASDQLATKRAKGKPGKAGKAGKADKPGKEARAAGRKDGGKVKREKATGKESTAGGGSKRVDLGVSVPKRMRTRVREMARTRGVTTDEIVEQILDAALEDR